MVLRAGRGVDPTLVTWSETSSTEDRMDSLLASSVGGMEISGSLASSCSSLCFRE